MKTQTIKQIKKGKVKNVLQQSVNNSWKAQAGKCLTVAGEEKTPNHASKN